MKNLGYEKNIEPYICKICITHGLHATRTTFIGVLAIFDSFYLAIISETNTFSKGFKKLTSLKQLSAQEGDFPTAEDQQNMSGFSEIVPFDGSFADVSNLSLDLGSEVVLPQIEVASTSMDHSQTQSTEESQAEESLPPLDESDNGDTDQSGSESEQDQARDSRKPRRPEAEQCLICQKTVKKMRDHLSNAHKLQNEPRVKRFLCTYYSTISTKKCYQCATCAKRMAFPGTHPKHHGLKRIFNRTDPNQFPVEVQLSLRTLKAGLALPYEELVEHFDQHQRGLADDGDIVTVNTLSVTLKKFLGNVIVKTKEFTETKELANCVRDFTEDYSLKRITIGNYLSQLKNFFTFLKLHSANQFAGFSKHPWDDVLKEVRKRYSKSAGKEKRRKTKELQAKVPTLLQVQEINGLVTSFLNKDLEDRVLHYRELCALNFLILSFRLNCRAGPLLHLTWNDVEVIKSEGKLDTDRHKTGRYYDVTIVLQQDQLKWLRRMRRRYVKEFKQEPSLVIASSVNRVEQSMSKNIRSVLAHLFEDKVGNKDFHATAVRKMWDTHFHNNRRQFKDSVFNSHLQQTGQ